MNEMARQTIATALQPDQRPEYWGDHAMVYESTYEPFTHGLNHTAMARLARQAGVSVRGVVAVSAVAPVWTTRDGFQETEEIDTAARIVERTRRQSQATRLAIDAPVMDKRAAVFAHQPLDAALSVFGVALRARTRSICDMGWSLTGILCRWRNLRASLRVGNAAGPHSCYAMRRDHFCVSHAAIGLANRHAADQLSHGPASSMDAARDLAPAREGRGV
jgi:hypothetical protein